MKLKVLLPTEVLLAEEVSKVVAEAEDGYFALLPRHVDFAAALVPGILFYTGSGGRENCLAVDGGILVKVGDEVLVSTAAAVPGTGLESLREAVETRFSKLDEEERKARSVLARLEVDTLRRFMELGGGGRAGRG